MLSGGHDGDDGEVWGVGTGVRNDTSLESKENVLR